MVFKELSDVFNTLKNCSLSCSGTRLGHGTEIKALGPYCAQGYENRPEHTFNQPLTDSVKYTGKVVHNTQSRPTHRGGGVYGRRKFYGDGITVHTMAFESLAMRMQIIQAQFKYKILQNICCQLLKLCNYTKSY